MFSRFRRIERKGRVPSVVILGGGYGGVHAALELQSAAKRGEIKLTLISRENFILFQPMLAEVISGAINPQNVVGPVRRITPHADVHQAEIEAVDTDNKAVAIRYPRQSHLTHIPYDHLIIAVGSATDLSQFPGVAEHAMPFKTLGDAIRLRNHLISMLEAANVEDDPFYKHQTLTFVIAGGGYTGVEVASEINQFLRVASKSYSNISPDECRVILLHRSGRILPELSEKLANLSLDLLKKRGIFVHLHAELSGATINSAVLLNNVYIPTKTLVATIGASANPVLMDLPCEIERGRLVVDDTLAVKGGDSLWAVGDCAMVPDVLSGGVCPPTAQFALQEAKIAAQNVLAAIRGEPAKPFKYKSRGVFVPLGGFAAATEAFGLELSGFIAWWLYRTFYLSQLPRIERKLRVVTDWTLDLIFPPDIVKVDINRPHGTSRRHYEAGEYIYRKGDIAHEFYVVLGGEVDVLREDDGRMSQVAKLGVGEYFGEISLLNDAPHSSSVRARTHAELLVMSGQDFLALASSSSLFSELVSGVVQDRIISNRNTGDGSTNSGGGDGGRNSGGGDGGRNSGDGSTNSGDGSMNSGGNSGGGHGKGDNEGNR